MGTSSSVHSPCPFPSLHHEPSAVTRNQSLIVPRVLQTPCGLDRTQSEQREDEGAAATARREVRVTPANVTSVPQFWGDGWARGGSLRAGRPARRLEGLGQAVAELEDALATRPSCTSLTVDAQGRHFPFSPLIYPACFTVSFVWDTKARGSPWFTALNSHFPWLPGCPPALAGFG